MEPAIDGMRDGKEQMSTGAARSKAVERLLHAYVFRPGTPAQRREFQKGETNFIQLARACRRPTLRVTTSIPASNKTVDSPMASSFTSEYLTMSEYLTQLLLQNSNELLPIGPTLALNIILGHHFEALTYELA
jgi:hypothetical protein